MNGIEAGLAVGLLAVFLGGVAIGLVIMVAIASHRDHVPGEPPDAATRGARLLTGIGSRNIDSESGSVR